MWKLCPLLLKFFATPLPALVVGEKNLAIGFGPPTHFRNASAIAYRCSKVVMAWAAKRPANEPLTGLFNGTLTAQFYLLFLIGPLTSGYQFLKSLSTFIFLLNVDEGL